MKTSVALVIGMLASAAGLSGCHRALPKPPAAQGIMVSQGRLVLPAVNGNPGVVYMTIVNRKAAPVTLVHVQIIGAHDAQMHETRGATMQDLTQLRIASGQQAVFAPGGKHIMVFGLAKTLAPGGTDEIVLRFQDGKTTSAPLLVEAAGGGIGGDPGDMGTMNMGGKP